MAIANSTLSVDVFNTVRNIIVAAAPQVVNEDASTKTASVLAAYNDKKPSTPQVIMYLPEREMAKDKFGGTNSKRFINVLVECYYKTSRGAAQLTDAVVDAVDSAEIDGMDLVAVSTDVAFINPNDQKFHVTGITFTFIREA